MKLKRPIHYSANITAGSLLVRESRKVAELLLLGLNRQEIKQKLLEENLFQVRAQSSTVRRFRLVMDRLQSLDKTILPLIMGDENILATQSVLACSVKHSRLLGDFMLKVIGRKIRIIDDKLSDRDWEKYLESCEELDPHAEKFTVSTRKKLRQIVFRILAESRFIESQLDRRLVFLRIEPELKTFLVNQDEKYVLKCLEVCE